MKCLSAQPTAPVPAVAAPLLAQAGAPLEPCAASHAAPANDRHQTEARALSAADRAQLRAFALARWDSAAASDDVAPVPPAPLRDDPPLTQAELVQLHVRVIALENLVIAMLAEAPLQQLALAREMASYISPRAGYTPHPTTLRAADEMLSLVDRASLYPLRAPFEGLRGPPRTTRERKP